MNYCTPRQVRVALAPDYVDETVPTKTAADLSTDTINDAIAEASSFIDSAIGARYAVPVAPIDDVIPHPIDFWARNIAAYLATCTYRGSIDFADTDPVYRRYATTISTLTDIKKGIGVLAIPTSVGTSSSASGSEGPINPYSGNLFETEDFDITYPRHINVTGTPIVAGVERGWW